MNSGKTQAYFAWAAENAMVPDPKGALEEVRPDYVVKADEDSFIMLGELEKRLRILGGKKVYWGCESSAFLSAFLLFFFLTDGELVSASRQTSSRTSSWVENVTRSHSISSATYRPHPPSEP